MHSQCWIQYKNDFIDDDNCSRQQSNSWPSIKNVQYRYGVCQYLQLNLQEINEEKICLSFYKFRKRSFKLISNFFTVTLSCQKMTTIRYSTTKAISCVRHKVKTIFFLLFLFLLYHLMPVCALCEAPWRVASRCSFSCLTQNFFH